MQRESLLKGVLAVETSDRARRHADPSRAGWNLMALGYGGNPGWRDMSEYLVHMTRDIESLMSIVVDRTIEARNAYGAARRHEALQDTQRVVCLSEIPLDHLGRLAARRGGFGLAFMKAALVPGGAAPVWYLEHGSPVQRQLFNAVRDAGYLHQPPDPDHILWKLTPFIDYPGIYGQREYKWEWEREWRKLGNLSFEPDDVRLVFAPESYHDTVRERWLAVTGIARAPVLMDPHWPLPLIQDIAGREDL